MLEPSSPPRPAHPISSVDNALRLLVILRDREEIRVSEAGAALGVARSTAHRLLAMLHSHGLVEQSANRAYRVGPVLAEIGLSALRHLDVRAHIRPFLEQLVAEVGETAHMVVREGRNCRFAESVECTHALRTTGRVGMAYPAHVTSGGKALLAELDDEELRELYPVEHLDGRLGSRTNLLAELEEIRRLGYARYLGDLDNGIAAVGLVLRTSSGRVAGALSVSAPETRMPEERIETVVTALRRVSEEARRRLP
jgi:IclR family transcriptional regulator, acetate operon repressor